MKNYTDDPNRPLFDSKEFELEDARLAAARFMDQPGQWIDTTPPEVKERQEKAWEKFKEMNPGDF